MAVKLIYVLHEDPARIISEQASGPKGQAGYMPKVRVPMLGLLKHELSLGRTFAQTVGSLRYIRRGPPWFVTGAHHREGDSH